MANIQEFRALLYSPHLRGNMSDLVSPPYDVISKEKEKSLREKSEFNSVHLSLVENSDDPDRYAKMAKTFRDWKEKGVLTQDQSAAFYLIEENYTVEGTQKCRLGFVGLLEVSPFKDKKVLPHEHTLAGPKKDRFELLKQMGAELSQIFLCYRDSQLLLEKMHSKLKNTLPLFDVPLVDGVQRKVWRISENADIQNLKALLRDQPLLIADGHHRYETAVHFRETEGSERSRFVQAYFMNLDSPNFSIQPIHRLFSLPENWTEEKLIQELKKTFEVKDSAKLDPEHIYKHKKESGLLTFFLKSGISNKIYLLSRKPANDEDAEIFSIQRDIFEALFKWDITQTSYGVLKYEHAQSEFDKRLKEMPRAFGLFLPPTDLELVLKKAIRGERMPQKSTYFYPKIATGLINYELGVR